MRELPKNERSALEPKETDEQITGELIAGGPTEAELVNISLLMRLYDLNLAILTHLDSTAADKLYEQHEKGENFNPPIFIPIEESMNDD